MLTDLTIKDVVIIDHLNLSFDRGFITLTGETGAGKSIILDSLGLAMGQRPEARLVRQGAEQASVTASFDNFDKKIEKELKAILAENDMAFELPLILRRVLSKDGKSKAFINDQPVSVTFLKNVGEALVEIHGQFETHALLDPKTHLRLLDDTARVQKELTETQSTWQAWRGAIKILNELEEILASAARDREFWQDTVKELRDLNMQPNEEEELVAQRSLMMHAEKILASLSEASQAIGTDKKGARDSIHSALRSLERSQDKMPEGFTSVLDHLSQAIIELDEAMDGIETLGDQLQFDRNAQSDTDERLFALRAAARKYSVAVVDLPQLLTDTEEKLTLVNDQSHAKEKAEKKVIETRASYIEAAEKLSVKRNAASTVLAKSVMAELTPLKLDKAIFTVAVDKKSEENWNADGTDQVTFLISTNPGTPPGPLNKIASGGEMARFMLALKVVTQVAEATPTIIFDEIDTGVGGAVAEAIGLRLKRLGENAQVFSVTHSPQVAAKGHQHLKITKETTKNVTRTIVNLLDDTQRLEEIARMLSGEKITAEARAAAGNLLDAKPAKAPAKIKKRA